MKQLLILLTIFSSLLFASTDETNDSKAKTRAEKQILLELEKEKKYAREKTFYQYDNYDFKGAEVNEKSLDTVPEIELDDLDMDSVYD